MSVSPGGSPHVSPPHVPLPSRAPHRCLCWPHRWPSGLPPPPGQRNHHRNLPSSLWAASRSPTMPPPIIQSPRLGTTSVAVRCKLAIWAAVSALRCMHTSQYIYRMLPITQHASHPFSGLSIRPFPTEEQLDRTGWKVSVMIDMQSGASTPQRSAAVEVSTHFATLFFSIASLSTCACALIQFQSHLNFASSRSIRSPRSSCSLSCSSRASTCPKQLKTAQIDSFLTHLVPPLHFGNPPSEPPPRILLRRQHDVEVQQFLHPHPGPRLVG